MATLRIRFLVALWLIAGVPSLPCQELGSPERPYDVVVYGETSAGIIAGIQAQRLGKQTLLIPTRSRIGGMTTNGLGQTDIGSKEGVGGLSRAFYERVSRYYKEPSHWRWQPPEAYRSEGQSRTEAGEDAMWTFEPQAALQIYQDMIAEYRLPVWEVDRLDRSPGGVTMDGQTIRAIRLESGRVVHGRMFIDATYVGDLMAAADVTYTIGREANATYGEAYNGIQTKNAVHHNFANGVSPFIDPDDASSGFLPGIDPSGPGVDGEADHRIQAYCFRLCLTDHPDNRIPFTKPDLYRELDYELLFRNFEAGGRSVGVPLHSASMPNRKTDTNNNKGFSTDFIGENYEYPEADYATRRAIDQRHREYQQGLMWTLAYHPRTPSWVRDEVSRWGLSRDEFTENGGWPELVYIREARRMVSDYVMTEADCFRRRIVKDPVGLGAYNMDSHNTQRYPDDRGWARNEGDVQVSPGGAYKISYRSIVPKRGEATNLLVPVCLSASHIAFGSIRMEPVFMVLGQSAATAASLAIDNQVAVQDLDYAILRERLEQDGQRLDLPEADEPMVYFPSEDFDGVVIDDLQVEGFPYWSRSDSTLPFVDLGYRHNRSVPDLPPFEFTFQAPTSGLWEARISYSKHENRATNAPITVTHADGVDTILVDQTASPNVDGVFHSLGTFRFDAGIEAKIRIGAEDTHGYVIADSVQLIPAAEE